MRVVVNQLATLGRKTGIGHYTGQLLVNLRALQGNHQIDDFPTGWIRRACRGLTRARAFLDTDATSFPRHSPGRGRWLAGLRGQALGYLRRGGRKLADQYFQAVCGRDRYDLYHEPNSIPFASDCPTLTTIHDLSVLVHPEWHPADRVAHYERYFRSGVARSAHVLVVSEFSRREVIRLLNLPPERVTRTYNGIRAGLNPMRPAEVARVLRQLGLPPRYLLYLGTIEPRKNVLMLLRAYCALPAALRCQWPLLLVGNWGWNTNQVAEYLHGEARQRGVIHRGYVPDRYLAAIYNGARALVYPSWYEGFGLPPVEMMACGGAVLASTAEALAETVGARAHLLDPQDVEGWRDGMARVLHDEDWWLSLRLGVRSLVRHFTWERCAAETLGVYRALCGESDSHSTLRRAAG